MNPEELRQLALDLGIEPAFVRSIENVGGFAALVRVYGADTVERAIQRAAREPLHNALQDLVVGTAGSRAEADAAIPEVLKNPFEVERRLSPNRFGSIGPDPVLGELTGRGDPFSQLSPLDAMAAVLGLDPDLVDPQVIFAIADQVGILQDFFPGAGGSGGAGNALGYAQLAESQRQFDATFQEGLRQFDLQFGLDAKRLGLDEQEYAARRQEFAQTFAENQRQFNEQQALAQSRFGLEAELGRGNLALQRERFGLEQEQARAQQRLREQEFTRDVLRSPSDYIFAAFESRGAQPPRDQITHADIISGLQENPYQVAPAAGAIPGFERGGSTGGNVVLTGEGGPELVFDNPDGTMDVIPVNQSKGKESRFGIPGAQDGGSFDPRAFTTTGTSGGFTPQTQDTFYNEGGPRSEQEVTFRRNLLGAGLSPSQIAATAESVFGVAPPPRQTPEQLQERIRQAAIRFSPPAVSAAISGNRIPNYRLATDLTLGGLRGLNDSELAALATRLGVVNNRSLADEVFELQRRYGPSGQRAGRFG